MIDSPLITTCRHVLQTKETSCLQNNLPEELMGKVAEFLETAMKRPLFLP
jgi:hypothetical protein